MWQLFIFFFFIQIKYDILYLNMFLNYFLSDPQASVNGFVP